jgi:hypothetical protein
VRQTQKRSTQKTYPDGVPIYVFGKHIILNPSVFGTYLRASIVQPSLATELYDSDGVMFSGITRGIYRHSVQPFAR